MQDRAFPVEWVLLADADPCSEAPLWGNAAAVVAASAEVLDPRGSPPDLEARGRGCLAGDEAGLGLVWLMPPAMDEDEEGRPVLLLALLPATAVWICVCRTPNHNRVISEHFSDTAGLDRTVQSFPKQSC